MEEDDRDWVEEIEEMSKGEGFRIKIQNLINEAQQTHEETRHDLMNGSVLDQ